MFTQRGLSPHQFTPKSSAPRPGVDAGWRILFAFSTARSRATQAERYMNTSKRLVLLIVLLGLVSAGCQTFTLTEEDFEKQQRGEPADREVGDYVGAAGTIYSAVGGAVK